MNKEERKIYNNILDAWHRTGKIGNSKPQTLRCAQMQAYVVATSIYQRPQPKIMMTTINLEKKKPEFVQLKLDMEIIK